MEELYELARKFLAEQMEIELESINKDTRFEDIDADSIDVVEMIMALEDYYEIEFPEEDLDEYPTMGSLVKALYEFLKQAQDEC